MKPYLKQTIKVWATEGREVEPPRADEVVGLALGETAIASGVLEDLERFKKRPR